MPPSERAQRAKPYEPPKPRAGRLSDEPGPPPRWALPSDAQPLAPPPPPEYRPTTRRAPQRPQPPPRGSRRQAPQIRSITPAQAKGRRKIRKWVAGCVLLIGLGLCAWIGQLAYKANDLRSDWFVTPPPRPAGSSAFPDWNKKERVNILLLGLDTRHPGDSRSDTMILVSIDPSAKTAALLSIPRDLWIPIPGFGENRINAAYQFGETNNVAGGGPGLAMQTVEQNFGVPVHYYAQVEFSGFQRIVDALGGVTIDVQHALIDNEYPADYGDAFQRIYIPSGVQHMDGRTALQYVRSRHADSDLARNDRQQAMLLALREEGTQVSIIGKLDSLLSGSKGALRTDLPLEQVGSLVQLAQHIPRENVQQLSLGGDMTTAGNQNGADVLLPNWDLIRPAIAKLLGRPDMSAEGAVVSVMNGTDTPGLALRTADQIRNAGFNVPANLVGNPTDAGGGRYPQTVVYDYTGGKKPSSLNALLSLLKLDTGRVKTDGGTPPPGADIQVMIGEDMAK
ncbi:MAG: LCP family protein [Chloroflexia bacterium]